MYQSHQEFFGLMFEEAILDPVIGTEFSGNLSLSISNQKDRSRVGELFRAGGSGDKIGCCQTQIGRNQCLIFFEHS